MTGAAARNGAGTDRLQSRDRGTAYIRKRRITAYIRIGLMTWCKKTGTTPYIGMEHYRRHLAA